MRPSARPFCITMPAAVQHVRAVGDRQREPDVLLDQEHSDTSVGRGPHCGEQLLDDWRSKA
jgi:hypothetical protein